jgi:ABC-type multidrug transport system fused ATPase/permease subunit
MSTISITAENLHFDYNEKTRVFEGHSLNLEVPQKQASKLYGIIGPSGAGKTTLLSIFGGQLNPTSGEVKINETNIYQVTDSVRRGLIGLQMQTSTSLRGKLKYNLLFGLPDQFMVDEKTDDADLDYENIYTDEDLVDVLKGVGLWGIFEDKDGLDTLIGEGGLNLSGGQRQRLNFAGLYLRSKYYKPSVILIDEPTSSLDELSELAITRMINELAEMALTLVVAHRLKTLDEAVGILDASLFEKESDMIFYHREELLRKSEYYRDLMAGKVGLDE